MRSRIKCITNTGTKCAITIAYLVWKSSRESPRLVGLTLHYLRHSFNRRWKRNPRLEKAP